MIIFCYYCFTRLYWIIYWNCYCEPAVVDGLSACACYLLIKTYFANFVGKMQLIESKEQMPSGIQKTKLNTLSKTEYPFIFTGKTKFAQNSVYKCLFFVLFSNWIEKIWSVSNRIWAIFIAFSGRELKYSYWIWFFLVFHSFF